MDITFHTVVEFAELPSLDIVPLRIRRNCWDCLTDISQFLGITRTVHIDKDDKFSMH